MINQQDDNPPFMDAPLIIIYAKQSTPRLFYVLNWLFAEQLGLNYQLVTNAEEAAKAKYCISYGVVSRLSIPAAPLLFEEGIHPQEIIRKEWNGMHTLFYEEGSAHSLPFDLFAGIFYLLSRYEEYGDFTPDRHGRFSPGNSILGIDAVLERPVLDEWVAYFRKMLSEKWPLSIPPKPFTFCPTYDIDIAWSYLHKGTKRMLGGALRDLTKLDLAASITRCRVMAGNVKDPYDAFEAMHELHTRYHLLPGYFILAALQSSPFDKNIHPAHPAMQKLIQSLKAEGPVGIHPSYFTYNDTQRLNAEKVILEQTTGESITNSRQHYIRLFLPATFRALIAAGITDDYSMGYSTALGFRAGTSHSFLWYDLLDEQQTNLRTHPFCFMDTTARYDLELKVDNAFLHLDKMKKTLMACGGNLTTIFHNFSLGTDPEWKGWKERYESFLSEL